mmetsp:Transcript_49842/g.132313  ORF Transcript_49842/g.132313 Transcript_49842/m.132313 type:complete len:234 (+) Transcript_49842:1148-1849(+)
MNSDLTVRMASPSSDTLVARISRSLARVSSRCVWKVWASTKDVLRLCSAEERSAISRTRTSRSNAISSARLPMSVWIRRSRASMFIDIWCWPSLCFPSTSSTAKAKFSLRCPMSRRIDSRTSTHLDSPCSATLARSVLSFTKLSSVVLWNAEEAALCSSCLRPKSADNFVMLSVNSFFKVSHAFRCLLSALSWDLSFLQESRARSSFNASLEASTTACIAAWRADWLLSRFTS